MVERTFYYEEKCDLELGVKRSLITSTKESEKVNLITL